jgi:hypothetical protein
VASKNLEVGFGGEEVVTGVLGDHCLLVHGAVDSSKFQLIFGCFLNV